MSVSKQAVGKCPPVNKHKPSPFNQPKAADLLTCCLSTHYNEKQGLLLADCSRIALLLPLFACLSKMLVVNFIFFTFYYLDTLTQDITILKLPPLGFCGNRVSVGGISMKTAKQRQKSLFFWGGWQRQVPKVITPSIRHPLLIV